MIISREDAIKQVEAELREAVNKVSALVTLRWVNFSSTLKGPDPTLNGAYSRPQMLEDLGEY